MAPSPSQMPESKKAMLKTMVAAELASVDRNLRGVEVVGGGQVEAVFGQR